MKKIAIATMVVLGALTPSIAMAQNEQPATRTQTAPMSPSAMREMCTNMGMGKGKGMGKGMGMKGHGMGGHGMSGGGMGHGKMGSKTGQTPTAPDSKAMSAAQMRELQAACGGS